MASFITSELLLNGASLLQEKNFQRVQNDWHHEEVRFREEELYRRQVEDSRRAVTEQAEQLKAISSLSALIAGFALIVQTNVSLDDSTLDEYLLYALAATTAIVISLMLFAMVKATVLLIALYRYNYDDDRNSQLWKDYKLEKAQVEVQLRLFGEGCRLAGGIPTATPAPAASGVEGRGATSTSPSTNTASFVSKIAAVSGVGEQITGNNRNNHPSSHGEDEESEGGDHDAESDTVAELWEQHRKLDVSLRQTGGRASTLRHWALKFDDDWQKAFKAFKLGIIAFPVLLGTVGWVVFWSHRPLTVRVCSTIIMGCAAVLMYSYRNILNDFSFLKSTAPSNTNNSSTGAVSGTGTGAVSAGGDHGPEDIDDCFNDIGVTSIPEQNELD